MIRDLNVNEIYELCKKNGKYEVIAGGIDSEQSLRSYHDLKDSYPDIIFCRYKKYPGSKEFYAVLGKKNKK